MRQFVSLIAVVFMMVPALAQQKPTVRAITAFVRLDRAQYQREVRDTLAFLRRAKAAFEQRGYQVESVRMTTQPFPDLVRGLKHDEALAFLLSYDELAQQEGFDTSLGPAMPRRRSSRRSTPRASSSTSGVSTSATRATCTPSSR